MNWITSLDGFTKTPSKPHLIDCADCGGAGLFTNSHPHDPNAEEFTCERCDGSGQTRCADDGCCDYDPPERDE